MSCFQTLLIYVLKPFSLHNSICSKSAGGGRTLCVICWTHKVELKTTATPTLASPSSFYSRLAGFWRLLEPLSRFCEPQFQQQNGQTCTKLTWNSPPHTHSNWTKIVKISDFLTYQGVWRNVETVIRVEFEVKLKMENDQVKSWVRPSLLLHVKVRWGMKSAGWDIKTMWISGRISLSFPRALLSTSRRSEAKSVSSLYYVSLFLT